MKKTNQLEKQNISMEKNHMMLKIGSMLRPWTHSGSIGGCGQYPMVPVNHCSILPMQTRGLML
uniref:Uncharacterized protein n=1 Tax=Romanomermis culicivorax TaxID=13658 RepID=A0A915IEU2_ROMCU